MSDLVSIIVPVYNSGRYVKECVLSVLAQTYHRWELLLIDDGSQDTTKDICMRLCEQDPRISLFCREHKGVSAARNAGIEHAKGKYLFFLDSDDAIHPALIDTLYGLMEKSRAAVGTEGLCHIENDRFPKCSDGRPVVENVQKSTYFKNSDALHAFIWRAPETALNSIGGKMIRRDALKAVKFDESFSNGEDTLFIYQVLTAGADVIFLPYSWYYYRSCKKSASKMYSVESIQSRYFVLQYIRNHEIENSRMENAVRCETILLAVLVQCYVEGRRSEDIKKYVRILTETEKKHRLFCKAGLPIRIQVFLLFRCYPLYWPMHIFLCGCFRLQAYGKKEKSVEKRNVRQGRKDGER